jgi:tetratricopeptide (TPR) repeat protein
MIEQTVSHYRILEKLGEGGMGIVYKAEDTKLRRIVALKFLPPEFTRDAKVRKRFIHEAQTASSLDHPNICAVHEIDETDDGRTFICMACYTGETIRDKIGKDPIPLEESIKIGRQIAQGLGAAHDQGIVHRDIKPANIILTEDGQVKIVDFGLAKLVGQPGITRTGSPVGTAAYMSPEQAQGRKVDHRSDIWAMGVVLFEMLTRQRPFRGEDIQETMRSVVREDPEYLTALRDDIPVELDRIVQKALAKRPEKRYQSAHEMAADLLALEGEGVAGAIARAPWYDRLGLRRMRRAKRHMLARILVVILFIAAGMGMFRFVSQRLGTGLDPDRVVVAAFENRTGDESLDPIGDMAADWITQGISQLSGIEAVPLTVAMESPAVSGSEVDGAGDTGRFRRLGEETGAGIIVSGTYYLEGESLHIQAIISDASTGNLIQNVPRAIGSREAPMELIEQLRERVLGALASRYEVLLGPQTSVHPPSFEAYREYLTGVRTFYVDYPQAVHHFMQAVALDSTFLQPRLWLIAAYHNLGSYEEADSMIHLLDRNRESLTTFARFHVDFWIAHYQGKYAECLRVMRRAHEHTPQSIWVMYLIGNVAIAINRPQETVDIYEEMDRDFAYRYVLGLACLYNLTKAFHMLGDHEREMNEIQFASNYYPGRLTLKQLEVRALAASGRIQEIPPIIEECRSLSPKGVEWADLGGILIEAALELRAHGYKVDAQNMAGRAVEWHEKLLREGESTKSTRHDFAYSLYLAGRWDEARLEFEKLALDYPDDESYQTSLGLLAARRGNRDEALRILNAHYRDDRPYRFGKNIYNAACIASVLGEKERAVQLLQEAFSRGFKYSIGFHRDPDLEPLWDYPPFMKLLEPRG